jgi:hypothetical protein
LWPSASWTAGNHEVLTMTDRTHLVGRKPKPPHKDAPYLVRFIHEHAEEKFASIASLAGVDKQTLVRWRLYGGDPKLSTVVAVLNAMGYDLVPVKREQK